MTIIQVNSMAHSWQVRGTLLPFADFRESARSMTGTALELCARTISEICESLKTFPDGVPETIVTEEVMPFKETWQVNQFQMHAPWWAMWREFPAAFAAYSLEIASALSVFCNKVKGDYHRKTWDGYLAKCGKLAATHLPIGFKYTPAVARRWSAEIPWLSDARLHASHRRYLLHAHPSFYRQYGWKDPEIKVMQPGTSYHQRSTSTYSLWFPTNSFNYARRQHGRLEEAVKRRDAEEAVKRAKRLESRDL
jgi:hypothetical protein